MLRLTGKPEVDVALNANPGSVNRPSLASTKRISCERLIAVKDTITLVGPILSLPAWLASISTVPGPLTMATCQPVKRAGPDKTLKLTGNWEEAAALMTIRSPENISAGN